MDFLIYQGKFDTQIRHSLCCTETSLVTLVWFFGRDILDFMFFIMIFEEIYRLKLLRNILNFEKI